MTEDLEIEAKGVESPEVEATETVTEDDMQKPVFNKHQVSKVVERERQKAYEKGKREALMQLDQAQQQQPAEQAVPQQQGQVGLGGMQQYSQDDIHRMIAEKAPQVLQDHVNQLKQQHVVDSFVSKMQAAEAKHPGLEAKLNDLDYSSLAPIIQMANDMENTGDIMKELVDNPMKMGNLLTLMYSQPRMAQKAMSDLSNSIKTNQDALLQEAQARDPMNQLKPSSSAGIDNSAMSVNDFRKMFR